MEISTQLEIFEKSSIAFSMPKLVHVRENLYACVFSVMKILPARYIIEQGIKRGEIKSNTTIVATSSGTFALGVAMVCRELGLKFVIFGDPAIDEHLYRKLKLLGGEIVIVTNPSIPGSYQHLRLKALHQYLQDNPNSFWMRQYDNPDNSKSYEALGRLIVEKLGKNLVLVGSVGSGGSTGGTIRGMRTYHSGIPLIGVDTFNSVLFGQPNGIRQLRGLGNTLLPKNVSHSLYDEIHWVCASDAYHHTLELLEKACLFCGPTSGAAYQVAAYKAKSDPANQYVFIAPDEGYRYQDTVYNEAWRSQQDFYRPTTTLKPQQVDHPRDAVGTWCAFHWGRRTYEEVLELSYHE
ncbi:pyridoxal-phosphate dependent enzyme [Vibrio ruber]|uniref:pyridoxal-phosphate dependent enzyme n=1 Tax=Vibrio ruber TaxID=184755 RepID=UPI00289371CC|nr:pyridoxal-phosphate dependent enzyme [Vibrio ruber]WNJ97403.1 pyridoxal-phosphate dependent enzyme [Vibrio ruber]